MICFLTSSTAGPHSDEMHPENGFIERLRECVPPLCRGVFLCSDPDNSERTDHHAASVQRGFAHAGLPLRQFTTLDRRNQASAAALISEADLIVLAGGHVPTQNRFFAEIGLRDLLQPFHGVLVGISAGSMNCAQVVYAHPEREGEAVDPAFPRFLPGLGLTNTMILPHYQMLKDDVLDGLRVMEDVAYPDSRGREFLLLVDGSYLYIRDGVETVYGEAYALSDGQLTPLCSTGGAVSLQGR